MAGASLLTLIDDIAALLDDVAIMSKVAAKKTAGVLGDDLAVNAQQVSGVNADRELPVVWAVAKGSFKNKFILVPAALAISVFAPWLITPLLLLGACFLCFEGAEKVIHWLFPNKDDKNHDALVEAVRSNKVDMVAFEQKKIKGAIRTDFILSAEIVVIALGTVQHVSFQMQALVVSTVALLITFGVYGLVAGIVKIDDAGLLLVNKSEASQGAGSKVLGLIGNGLLSFAPKLMKTLTVVGTVAMFLVGGGIFTHGVPWLHHLTEASSEAAGKLPSLGTILGEVTPVLMNLGVGAVVGLAVLALVAFVQSMRSAKETA